LVACADAASVFSVKVLVKLHQILEVRVFGVAGLVAVTRSLAVFSGQKDAR